MGVQLRHIVTMGTSNYKSIINIYKRNVIIFVKHINVSTSIYIQKINIRKKHIISLVIFSKKIVNLRYVLGVL